MNEHIKPFVITGCGRSGTTYSARLLSSIGLTCGHEDLFPAGIPSNLFSSDLNSKKSLPLRAFMAFGLKKIKIPHPFYGEAAWEAAPFIKYINKDHIILHQLRDPVKFINSRYSKGLTYKRIRSYAQTIYSPFEYQSLPEEKKICYWADFWIKWNQLIIDNSRKHKTMTYKIEDMNVQIWQNILKELNFKISQDELLSAMESLSNTTNSLKNSRTYQQENDIVQILKKNKLFNRLKDTAATFEYDL